MSLNPTDRKGPVILLQPDSGESMDQLTPPLGTLAIAGYLERLGEPFAHIDQTIDLDARQAILSLVRDGALCLAVGSMTGRQVGYGYEITKAVKEAYPGFPVIWAGWHASILPRQTLACPHVDIVIRGQGECSLKQVVSALRAGQTPMNIPGVSFKSDGEIFEGPDRPLVDLNLFPPMAYHLIDLKKYPGPKFRGARPNDVYVTFRSSQGCPWRCSYCADPLVFRRRWVALTPERTVDEIERLARDYGVTFIDFVDDTYVVDRKRCLAVSEELIRRKVGIRWSACARTGMVARLDQTVLEKFAESGCTLIHPGVEAPTQDMLDVIQKDEKNENTLIAAEKLKRAGIAGLYSFMVAYPKEEPDLPEKTFDMIRRLKEIDPNNITPVNFYVPYPGNTLYEEARKAGFRPPEKLEDWVHFGTREGKATPWVSPEYKDRVMKLDKFYLPAAFPSETLRGRMQTGSLAAMYKTLHRIARYRVDRDWFEQDLDWKILRAYWRFWERNHRRLNLPNIRFR